MANIELVIKIPEEDYDILINHNNDKLPAIMARNNLWEALKHGIPLPEGHGRLIDVKDLKKDLIYMSDFSDAKGIWEEDIDDAPTIIEADKEGIRNDI